MRKKYDMTSRGVNKKHIAPESNRTTESKSSHFGVHDISPGSEIGHEEMIFGRACYEQMKLRGVRMLTCGQVLAIAKALGYRKEKQ